MVASCIGWLLKTVVMAHYTRCRHNVHVWLCCSRLASHSYEIVTECCGSLDTSSRPDRRKVTVTGHVNWWLIVLRTTISQSCLSRLQWSLLMHLSSLFFVTLQHFFHFVSCIRVNCVTWLEVVTYSHALQCAAIAYRWFDTRLTYGKQRRRWNRMPVDEDEVDLIISAVHQTEVEVTCYLANIGVGRGGRVSTCHPKCRQILFRANCM